VIATASCTRQLAPAPIPAGIMPPLPVSAAPAPGNGRLIVDVAEGPVPVYRARIDAQKLEDGTRHARYRIVDVPPELVCKETPCVIDEPPGNILIGFPVLGCRPAIDFDLVHVGLDASVYRRSVAIFENDTGVEKIVGIIGASIGGAASLTGIVLLPIGAGGNTDLAIAGGITLGVGALLTTAGVLMIRHDSATYRPGSANHFEATAAPTAPPSPPPSPTRSPLEVYPYYDCSWSSRRGGTG
jgi:hypothetical protein